MLTNKALQKDKENRVTVAKILIWLLWGLPALSIATNLILGVFKKVQPWAVITLLVAVINFIAVGKVWGRRIFGLLWLVMTFLSLVAFAVAVFVGPAHWPNIIDTLIAIVLSCVTALMMLLPEENWVLPQSSSGKKTMQPHG